MSEEVPLIQMLGLSKTFRHRGKELHVLRSVDLKIHAGDRVSIMGSSGAGKSTLLQIMGTLDSPTGGKLLFNGADVFGRSEKDQAKFRNAHVGFVFQFHHLLPEFTALENVMMPGLIGRARRADVERDATELLERVGLAERLHHQPGELSGGEQQRVAIARALFMKPRLLLADEPTGNLDLATGGEIHALLRELHKSTGITVVVVTHDPNLAAEMDVRLLVDDGRIIPMVSGDPKIGDRLPEGLLNATPRKSQMRVSSSESDS